MFSQSLEPTNDCEVNVSNQWQNLSIYDEEPKEGSSSKDSLSFIDDKALHMMKKMGYKSGSGLGKIGQGIITTIEVPCQLGKRGFGLKIKGVEATNEDWDFTKEEVNVREKVNWLINRNEEECINWSLKNLAAWMQEGLPNHNIKEQCNFCDENVLHDVLRAKDIFDELNLLELCQARTKANPFETIRSVFFMNRAALKMANIDAATDFMFSNIDQNVLHAKHTGPYYFADVCAGPGGFSEYILWRNKWYFKGFGLTLKDENDFKLNESMCASPVTFQALYGKQEDGDVCCPENIEDFKDKVLHDTDGIGVHFMMADGGFSVEGNENIQEILSKNIYICQCLVALEIVRPHGHFVTKLFDVFTPFSVGLLYLMHKCFDKVAILKPNSSRPANSERYLICHDLKQNSIVKNIKAYLWIIVRRLWQLKEEAELDILEIVPLEIITGDEIFFSYILESNNRLGKRQTVGLLKLAAFCRNTNLVEKRQEELRKSCLEFWQVPDIPKLILSSFTVNDLIDLALDKPEILLVQPREINSLENFTVTVADLEDWHYCPMYGSQKTNNCNFYAGIGSSRVYRLQRNKWAKVKNMQLVRGTLLYGEFVKEKIVLKTKSANDTIEESFKYSLHVIDALRLGDKSLADLKFKERLNLVQLYCKSVNKESLPNSIRIRPKTIHKLANLATKPLVKKNKVNNYFSTLPPIGYNSFSEIININSLLLLKTNDNQSFYSTYVLRVQIFISSPVGENEEKSLSLEQLMSHIKQK